MLKVTGFLHHTSNVLQVKSRELNACRIITVPIDMLAKVESDKSSTESLTALHLAVYNTSTEMIRLLLKLKANTGTVCIIDSIYYGRCETLYDLVLCPMHLRALSHARKYFQLQRVSNEKYFILFYEIFPK